ncbi:hypothetical protein DITRI_Ditri10aG0011200 [Diplodiscus trichospermus]
MRAEPGRNNNNSSYIAANSHSKSSSYTGSSSSPAACSPPSPANPDLLAKQSMEEVWKDISLASLNDHPTGTVFSTTSNNPNYTSVILQDFLARPLNKEPPRRSGVSSDTSLSEEITLFSPLAPTPGTILCLNSGSDFQYMESGDPVTPSPAANACSTGVATHNSSFHVFGSPAVFPSFCKKRAQENNGNSDDRRYKRMMKNRESAARSRARKQAYTNELELEVAHLLEENAKLRRQQDKLLAAPPQLPKKNTLSRTLTAPF